MAPQAILEAAGGVFTDVRGEKINYLRADVHNLDGVLVSNGAAHSQIVQIIQEFLHIQKSS